MALVGRVALRALFLVVAALLGRGVAAQVPIDGFFPLVGIGLTDEFIFDDLLGQNPVPEVGVSGSLLGAGGTPYYDIALLDTGAGLSLVTDTAFDRFGLGESGQGGGTDGYRGTETVPIGGATGVLNAAINDPLGLYATGLQDRTGAGAALAMNNSLLQGQTNTSTLTFPPESDLPNIVGLPFASQYATQIRNDQPQVFELGGKTIRSPAVNFLPLGSGGGDIARKAPLSLNPGAAFTSAPGYFQNILNIVDGVPVHENPQLPTGMAGGIASGGLFLDMFASNDGSVLGSQGAPIEFFFDTGASVTVLSESSAATLGFDVVTDTPEFTISLVGSGGQINDVPGFYIDQITLPALGGAIVANNVPVVVLDVTDVSDPGNIVPGILGTNLLAGRNVVIDPNPSIGAGGESAGVYISDPITSDFVWDSTATSAAWSAAGAWEANATPDYLSVTRLEPTDATDQEAVVAGEQQAWDLSLAGGDAGEEMMVRIVAGGKLTTFSGATIEEGGVVLLQDGTIDAQYLDIRGGTLTGEGSVRTGSGPIVGQVESINGMIAPGDGVGSMEIDGRLSLGGEATLQFELGGTAAGSQYDQLVVTDSVALDGTLEVSLVDAGVGLFAPSVGDVFTLITYDSEGGTFDTLDLPAGYEWSVSYGADNLTLEVLSAGLFAGDINGDGSVDLLDLDILGANFGSTSATFGEGDINGDGNVDLLDLDLLGSVFGTTVGSAAVPEPTALLLLTVAASAAAVRKRR